MKKPRDTALPIEMPETPPPPVVDDLSWDEGESVLRQLEKELQAARKGHLAFRTAREADETRVRLEAEIAGLMVSGQALRVQIDRETADADSARAARDRAHDEVVAAHAAAVERMTRERAALTAELATAQGAVDTAHADHRRVLASLARDAEAKTIELERAYNDARTALQAEIDALEARRLALEEIAKETQAKVAALA